MTEVEVSTNLVERDATVAFVITSVSSEGDSVSRLGRQSSLHTRYPVLIGAQTPKIERFRTVVTIEIAQIEIFTNYLSDDDFIMD